jgi:LysM repeat protein
MENHQQSSPARLAAIIALIATAIVLLVIVVGSLSGGGGSGGGSSARNGGAEQGKSAQKQSQRKIYVVKPGDCCLSEIADKTGIDVDKLIQLNPHLDPQAIHSGDRVKLR